MSALTRRLLGLKPSAHLTAAEVAAAGEVHRDQLNAQMQTRNAWAPSFAVARARFDQLARTCTTTVSGRHNGPLIVSGTTCLNGATVTGPVVVRSGGSLLGIDSSISGPVAATSAKAVHLYHSTVRGPVSIAGTSGSAAIVDSTVQGRSCCPATAPPPSSRSSQTAR